MPEIVEFNGYQFYLYSVSEGVKVFDALGTYWGLVFERCNVEKYLTNQFR